MGDDSDFAGYLAARWPALVRTLVLLGCPQHVAEDVARTALADCQDSWDRVRRADDVDVHVYRTLLACRRERLRGAWWDEPAPARPLEAQYDESDDRELEAVLDQLTPDLRVVLVLSRVAGLDEEQVAGVLELSLRTVVRRLDAAAAQTGERELHESSETIDVLAPPSETVLAHTERPRRRVRPAVAGAALALTVLAGLGTWHGTRSQDDPAPEPPHVTDVENPADVAWWAGGLLHLQHVTVTQPDLTEMAEVDGGVVLGDSDGRVWFVAADGTRTRLGQKEPRQPLVANDERGWAAWVDPDDAFPELVVYDVPAREVLTRRGLAPHADPFVSEVSHPIALDQDKVFYTDRNADWELTLPGGQPHRVEPGGLAGVRHATRVWQVGTDRLRIVQPMFSVEYLVAGNGAQMSPDSSYLLTREPPTAGFEGPVLVLLYDTRSGERPWTGLRAGEVPVSTALGTNGEVTYMIATRVSAPAPGGSFPGPYELRTCQVELRTCRTVLLIRGADRLPVLPH